jgi:hypothetical protein
MAILSNEKVVAALQKLKKKKARAIQRWKLVGDNLCFFRSNWEYKYACYLQWLKSNRQIQEWQHEPRTFWFKGIKRGCVSYKPDFYVLELDGTHTWVEVKGYMDNKSKTKIKRFAKYFPEERLTVVQGKWFTGIAPKLKGFVVGWD